MVRSLALALTAGLVAFGAPETAPRADAHPLHSTLTELVIDPSGTSVRVTVRAFVDDLRAAVARSARGRPVSTDGPEWSPAIVAYAASTVAVVDGRGRVIGLHSCGSRRTGDLTWVCLEGALARDAGALQVRNVMFCELYEDQVNVVQSVTGGSRRSLLFVRGDRFKPVQ